MPSPSDPPTDVRTARTPASLGPIANWTHMLALILRRDRVYLPIWIVASAVFCTVFVVTIPQFAGTAGAMESLSEMMKNPAMIAMCGIAPGPGYTPAVLYTQLMMVFSAMLVAVMNILIVIRHTRTDEDEGRTEVLRALPTGRASLLAAVTVVMVAANLIMALIMGFGMASFAVESVTLAGSLLYGACVAGCGLVFMALTMVVVQLVHTSHSATAASLVLLGVFYVIRAYGDIDAPAASWISPFGLAERTLPFGADRWWPVAILAGIAVVLIVVSFALNSQRDLGAGLLPQLGRSRAHAPRSLSGEWGLAWRLTRSTIIAWAATVFIVSAGYGSVMGEMESFVMSSTLYQQIMGVGAGTVDLVGPVVSTLLLIMALIAVIPILTTAYKLHSEERKGRLDQILGLPVKRTRLYGGYAVLILLTAVGIQLLAALGFWCVALSVMTDPVHASVVFTVAFNDAAALVFFGGLGLLLVGWAKNYTWIGWAYLVASFLVVYMGGLVNIPRWAQRLTPFGLLNRWPTEPFNWWAWAALVVGGALLTVVGAVGFRRRDITA